MVATDAQNEVDWIGDNLRIIPKELSADLAPLRFNKHQHRLHYWIEFQQSRGFPVRIIILKARQLGMSTGAEAVLFARSFRNANRKAFVCAHDDDQSTELFRMTRLFEQNLPARRPTAYSSRKEIVWEEPHNSSFQVQTAGKEKLKRGSTIHYCHLSEVAFYTRDKQTLLSVLQAVPDEPGSVVIMESTANGVGGEFYERWDAACERVRRNPKDLAGYIPLFFSWLDNPEEYSRALPVAYEWGQYDPDEVHLMDLGASHEQLYWRRLIIEQKCGGDPELFKQEYPSTPEEAFLMSGRRAIPAVVTMYHREQKEEPTPVHFVWDELVDRGVRMDVGEGPLPWSTWWMFKPPHEEHDYVGALDIAEGEVADQQDETSEPDYTGGGFIDRVTKRMVLGYRARLDADLAGDELLKAAIWYNDAWITPEANAAGQASLLWIKRKMYPRLYIRWQPDEKLSPKAEPVYGWKTTQGNRDQLIDDFIAAVRPNWAQASKGARWSRKLVLPWDELIDEEDSFVYDKTGKRQHRPSTHDDILFGIMIAWQLHLRCPRTKESGPVIKDIARSFMYADGVDAGVEGGHISRPVARR